MTIDSRALDSQIFYHCDHPCPIYIIERVEKAPVCVLESKFCTWYGTTWYYATMVISTVSSSLPHIYIWEREWKRLHCVCQRAKLINSTHNQPTIVPSCHHHHSTNVIILQPNQHSSNSNNALPLSIIITRAPSSSSPQDHHFTTNQLLIVPFNQHHCHNLVFTRTIILSFIALEIAKG